MPVWPRSVAQGLVLSGAQKRDSAPRLDALSKRSKGSKSFLAAEAMADVETEEWQLGELQSGIAELESGKGVSHDKVSKWLKSYWKSGATQARSL